MSRLVKREFLGINVLLLLLIMVFTSSCGNVEEIEIGDPRGVKINGFEDNYLSISAEIPVNNPSMYSFKIKEMDVKVFLNGTYMGKLIVDDVIKVKRKSEIVYDLPVKIRLANLFGAAFVMMNMKEGQEVVVKFEGTVKAQSMLVTREFPIKETKNIRL